MNVLCNLKAFVVRLKFLYRDWKYINLFADSDKKELDVTLALLRKNCHILDKGLHIVPFDKGHGRKTYNEALALKRNLVSTPKENDLSFLWCCDIIALYEKAQKNELKELNIPFHNYNKSEKQLIYDFLHSRVSCRNFNNIIIDDCIWNEIIGIAADAPNGCCRQTSRIYVVNDRTTISKLKHNIGGATGFSNGIPYLLCVTSDVRSYACMDRMLAYIDASLFVENLVLACRANNVFTTILNFQHASEKERNNVMELLNILLYERIIVFIAAGRVDFVPVKPLRMHVNEFRKL